MKRGGMLLWIAGALVLGVVGVVASLGGPGTVQRLVVPSPFGGAIGLPCASLIGAELEREAAKSVASTPPLSCSQIFASSGKDGTTVYRVMGDGHDTWAYRAPGKADVKIQPRSTNGRAWPIERAEGFSCGELTQTVVKQWPAATAAIGELKACANLDREDHRATDGALTETMLVRGSRGTAFLVQASGGFNPTIFWKFTFADGGHLDVEGYPVSDKEITLHPPERPE